MLPRLSEDVQECYSHAAERSEWARQSLDAATQQEFFDMAHRWQSLARNYEFSEQLYRFAKPFKRRK
jgi:hypothetical protein